MTEHPMVGSWNNVLNKENIELEQWLHLFNSMTFIHRTTNKAVRFFNTGCGRKKMWKFLNTSSGLICVTNDFFLLSVYLFMFHSSAASEHVFYCKFLEIYAKKAIMSCPKHAEDCHGRRLSFGHSLSHKKSLEDFSKYRKSGSGGPRFGAWYFH